ncbi:unnamed protein product, partial [Didymodactylos carnosus]
PRPFNLKYEILIACFLTMMIYYVQLCVGMKHYQQHMLNAYKGIFIDIPPRHAFNSIQLISKNAHYPGYTIAYLAFGYLVMGNVLFLTVIIIRILFKHLFLIEELSKIIIPILVIYLCKYILMWVLSRTLFLQH